MAVSESTTYGDHNTPAPISEQLQLGGSWELWENLAKQSKDFRTCLESFRK